MNDGVMQKLLFTTDLSPECKKAFEYALKISSALGSEILILHVFEELSDSKDRIIEREIGLERLQNIHSDKMEQARDVLIGKRKNYVSFNDESKASKNVLRISERVISGKNTADQICETAKEEDCDLIIMAIHRRGKIEKILGKNTINRVTEKSNIPILVFPLDYD